MTHEQRNAYDRERRAEAAKRGMCAECAVRPKAPRKGGRCEKCNDRLLAWRKEFKRRNRLSGLCKCGQIPRPGMKTCQRCATYNVNWIRKTYVELKAARLCPKCGRDTEWHPPLKHRTLCEVCLEQWRDRSRKRRRKLMREGRCAACGEPHESKRITKAGRVKRTTYCSGRGCLKYLKPAATKVQGREVAPESLQTSNATT